MPSVLGRLSPNMYAANALLRRFRCTATLLPIITDQTPGAAGGPTFDSVRSEDLIGSIVNGIGWQVTVGGVLRVGFLPPQRVIVGVQEAARHEIWTPDGQIDYYEGPVVLHKTDVVLKKWDILALDDGRRYLVADTLRPIQQLGVIVLNIRQLEKRDPGSAIYAVPLT